MKHVLVGMSILVAGLTSCSGDPQVNNALLVTHTPLVQKIFYSDDSLFHGISLGMTITQVKQKLAPGDSIMEEQSNYLYVEGQFDTSKIYSWDCDFDDRGLSALTLDVYLKDEAVATAWFTDITSYFTDRFGAPTDDGIALTWEVKNTLRPARIELVEELGYGYGKLNVYYYDLSFIPLDESDTIQAADSFKLPSDNLQ
jgi:hypothetical protein